MVDVNLNLEGEKEPTIRGWLYWLSSWGVLGVFCAGWTAYFLGSVFFFWGAFGGPVTKAGLPVGLFLQSLPFLILYGLFLRKVYRRFLQSRLSGKCFYILLSFILMLLWLAVLGSGTLINSDMKCLFYGA